MSLAGAIMYHFAVGQSGTIYEMNPMEILWHVTNGNGKQLASCAS